VLCWDFVLRQLPGSIAFMPLSTFHPLVSRWFRETLGEPTAAQRQGWAAIREGRHTLIAAPTGSGKTLAAFLTSLDDLFTEGLRGPLPDEVRVVYVSPLKALSADIHKNLAEPRRGIRLLAEEAGLEAPRITAAVRTGDTTQRERAAMLRTPPHILVTTPESLYLLLTAERARGMLRTVRTVIVDEIHAVIGTRRGAHLALTLERLQKVAERPLIRLGLSATQNPIEEVARFLVGTANVDLAAGDDVVNAGTEAADAALIGSGRGDGAERKAIGSARCAVVNEGHRRDMDLGLEMPRSTLDAVISNEIWDEYYERLTQLIGQHHTTLIFVNTRRMAERLARHLSERLGVDAVTAHHGSLSKEKRLDAEARLKAGQLQALVATASLELGIDIGSVDLVCQIGSPRRIATLLQRVGRSGHSVSGLPKGRIFPTSRDDLIECLALLRASRRGELDLIVSHDAPLDVLAQQIVAESACCDYSEDELYAMARGAWTYRDLSRAEFDAVIAMTAEGFSTRKGRRSALIHRDEVNTTVRGRRGARLLAITSGGAIPEVADYRVLLEPGDTFIGTLNEDFAIESNTGDIFQLGNASWRILRIGAGVVRVADAQGAPPSIPFWLGEAPGRSNELSRAVSDLRADLERAWAEATSLEIGTHVAAADVASSTAPPLRQESLTSRGGAGDAGDSRRPDDIAEWLTRETGAPDDAAQQALDYLDEGRRALGVLPTQETLVLERFFDESGGMQLVLHSPFGSRINKAWGLALRKRFCRQFNFELQAAATEDALLLSLGPQHSFPLSDVFRYLHPATARDVLVQAFLDAPVFQTRWRWNTTVSLAVPRNRGGRKVAPQLQRMLADDLMAAVFPDAAACLENIPGDRQIPDHPLVSQTVRDCLQEAMDFDGLAAILTRIHNGDIRLATRDTPEPSTLAHEILNARPYAFLDDAPLEERRTQAVFARRAGEPSGRGEDLGALDAAAIARVRDEARPDPRDADELHDVLLTVGLLAASEADANARLHDDASGDDVDGAAAASRARPSASDRNASNRSDGHASVAARKMFDSLISARRATRVTLSPDAPQSPSTSSRRELWVAAERLPELLALHPHATLSPVIAAPPSRSARTWTPEEALVEFVRGRMTIAGPITASELSSLLSVEALEITTALQSLEAEGAVLRGRFTPGSSSRERERELEWCDRRLLARIHRYTLNRLRSEIEPVSPADFMRFLFAWQHAAAPHKLSGVEGLRTVIGVLDGFELAAGAWERHVLPARLDRYDPSMLDLLCLSGEIGWARLSAASASAVALFPREHGDDWQTLREASETHDPAIIEEGLSDDARQVLEVLRRRGASFSRELLAATKLDEGSVRRALHELVEAGVIASDGFAGLRAMTSHASASNANGHGSGGVSGSSGRGNSNSDGAPGRRESGYASRSDVSRDSRQSYQSHQSRGSEVSGARDTRVDPAGRWSILRGAGDDAAACEAAVERQAWTLLKRYGVVFRRLLTREANARPWRELTRIYRRLEARGEIRGGRFVTGMSGEQFALPEAIERMREIRRSPAAGALLVVSAADPLNLAGIVTTGDRVRAIATSRIVYRDGVPLAAMEGDYVRPLAEIPAAIAGDVASTLAGRRVPPIISGYIGRTG
jgi:ATP-dependent helicase Lhr and Lhr-like helicase